jgi:NADH-quinone oxidoreductase subunit G
VVRAAGDARPGWKVLRVLGNLLKLDGFDQDSSEQVRDAVLGDGVAARLSARFHGSRVIESAQSQAQGSMLERIADVPIYFADPIVRRASSLQNTTDALAPRARLNSATAARLGVAAGQSIRLSQSTSAAASLPVAIDEQVADGVVRLAAAHVTTAALNAMIGPITGEPV